MSKIHRQILPRRRTTAGAHPGEIAVDPAALQPTIHLFRYSAETFEEQPIESLEEMPGPPTDGQVQWLNIDGLGDAATVARVGELYDLHPLALEDVVNTHQRPKAEVYDDRLFIVTRMVMLKERTVMMEERLHTEQVTIFSRSEFRHYLSRKPR